MENACYNINVRGTEVPKHTLASYFRSDVAVADEEDEHEGAANADYNWNDDNDDDDDDTRKENSSRRKIVVAVFPLPTTAKERRKKWKDSLRETITKWQMHTHKQKKKKQRRVQKNPKKSSFPFEYVQVHVPPEFCPTKSVKKKKIYKMRVMMWSMMRQRVSPFSPSSSSKKSYAKTTN